MILTSQTWRDIAWKHQLIVFRPAQDRRLDPSKRFSSSTAGVGTRSTRMRSSRRPAERGHRFHAPGGRDPCAVAVVRQVPFQPLFERREDALIAYTFDSFLKTGDTDWPLLLPMVKSAARAMDAVQEIASTTLADCDRALHGHGRIEARLDLVAHAAVDPRVASVAPMVIDMLNMRAQIELQRATFGDLSEEIHDYSGIDLPGRIDSDLGRKLVAMVDPYSYRESLAQPKLILLGTNDRYWPLDALKLYWKRPPRAEARAVHAEPGTLLRDADRLIGSLSALHRYSAHGQAFRNSPGPGTRCPR